MIKNLQNDKELTNSEDNKAGNFCGKKWVKHMTQMSHKKRYESNTF